MIVFAPWAFGATEEWSMNVLDLCGYALGLLLLAKVWIRARTGYRPVRWGENAEGTERFRHAAWVTRLLAGLTIFLLCYTFLSAANARASYDWERGLFSYRDCIEWLPHSYDAPGSWRAFANYVAWACFFWAVRDWLLTRTEMETVAASPGEEKRPSRELPGRLQLVLWVLCLNAAALSLEMLIQRTDGTNKLLWLRKTYYNRQAESQLGPFAYRANGAEFLNLIWPVTLGFWFWQQRLARRRRDRNVHHVLLACVMITAATVLISLSRGAALVAVGLFGVCGVIVMGMRLRRWKGVALAPAMVMAATLIFGLLLGWDELGKRMTELGEGYKLREHTYEVARRMAADYPIFGTGPETFQPVFLLYKISPREYAPGQVHNDWLETRITFGWVGLGAIVLSLGLAVGRWLAPGGLVLPWSFVAFVWAGMAGLLLHARWDLPFQVYSIVLTFLLLCAILVCGSRR